MYLECRQGGAGGRRRRWGFARDRAASYFKRRYRPINDDDDDIIAAGGCSDAEAPTLVLSPHDPCHKLAGQQVPASGALAFFLCVGPYLAMCIYR